VLSINLNAQYSYSYLNLGIYYYKNQEFPKALKNLEKAKDLDSETLFVNEFIEKIKSLN
jgi:tetratricopeptide (TPR) repeat protein